MNRSISQLFRLALVFVLKTCLTAAQYESCVRCEDEQCGIDIPSNLQDEILDFVMLYRCIDTCGAGSAVAFAFTFDYSDTNFNALCNVQCASGAQAIRVASDDCYNAFVDAQDPAIICQLCGNQPVTPTTVPPPMAPSIEPPMMPSNDPPASSPSDDDSCTCEGKGKSSYDDYPGKKHGGKKTKMGKGKKHKY